MLFSSTVFLFLFLPIVLFVYLIFPKRLHNLWLLLASLFFYTWGEAHLVEILLISILANYLSGLIISNGFGLSPIEPLPIGEPRTRQQKLGLVLSIVVNLTLLGFYKYFNFGIDSFYSFLSAIGIDEYHDDLLIEITLPLGISFFTFQAMSYTIDVYLGKVRATRNILNFATYISLFPQLVAGPIVRYKQIADELVERTITLSKMSKGIKRFIIGLGKKIIIANVVAWPADQIFALPNTDITTSLAWFAVLCYALQIYFDFSGYSDMAIGLGQFFGFHFPENFNYPYVAQSIQDFWRRWHISLSSWFRDYLYIPLGGNQRGRKRTYINLLIVFFLCGLWHGASWTFVIWGLYHGTFLVLERTILGDKLRLLWRPLRHGYTLLVVLMGWLIFRAENFSQLMTFLVAMVGLSNNVSTVPNILPYWNTELALILPVALIGSIPCLPYLAQRFNALTTSKNKSSSIRVFIEESASICFTSLIFIWCAMSLSAQTHNPFIYFRF